MSVDQVDPLISSIYQWMDVSGVLLMGVIGGTLARQRGYDIVGFFFIAMLSALGGGMLRDVLINQGTVAAMRQPEYLILAFTGALIARFTYFKGRAWEFLQSHGDALVSALWAATGASKAIQYGLPVLPTIMMGVFTATGGSMIRDVVTGREPAVFGGNQPTVLPAVACAVIVLVGNATGLLALSMVLGPITSYAMFLFGYYGNWRVSQDPDFAPVNATVNATATQVVSLARKAEDRSRAVARGLEPKSVRTWRHRQMEKALQRRIEKEIRRGKQPAEAFSEADEFLTEFTNQFPAIDSEMLAAAEAEKQAQEENLLEGIGVDLAGDSYDDDAHTTVEPDPAETEAMHADMLDIILSDAALTDELIERLAERYKNKDS
ncbi:MULTISPECIES: trimeric intracellular cation channel family protein [unclassified Corynebacterium]|uniref:trimeric intracellular cation channel family protein n=1 Tax=unclassified Corynebacterium TaxID=2624378 RepID=UPI002651BCC7|nr:MULTISPECIES: trimeric intracellular cation channel family protein [unclassified Corynebacterium]MDN8594629.1 trimeric intracellular cation channel family protein [Corynebacterium sp. P4_F2]WKK56164.1 trimeric intracellular cation channel family protein [Corynebacterium sp. P4-C1]WKK63576.1 trimeric intracellular cation channel family protein [Corynebacterium sp. P8-C1]